MKETSRDAAFCAHVVYNREPMIVPDTFQDKRFADNPLVINEPRIRFYAGCPLILDDGACIGTLCVIDTRPRPLEVSDVARLRDLADLAVQEIHGASAERRTPTPSDGRVVGPTDHRAPPRFSGRASYRLAAMCERRSTAEQDSLRLPPHP